MGEYADIALQDGFDDYQQLERGIQAWGQRHPGIGRIICQRCNKRALHWRKVEGKWRLHHYALFGDMTEPAYVLHRCGFQSDGRPTEKAPAHD